jgi:membrane associated rhomboid family serine protease
MIQQTDSVANTLATVSGVAAVASFATSWQPIISMAVGIIGIISGVLASVYYIKGIFKK